MGEITIKKRERESGIELFRCVLMYMIIFVHMLIHGVNGEIVSFRNGQVYETTLFESCFSILCMVSVNCYVMISGYFGIKPNKTKLIKTYVPVLFYSFFIALIFFVCKKISVRDLLLSCMPIVRVSYWFATCYIFLCFISPALNYIAEKFYKIKRFYFVIFIFLVITWLPKICIQLKTVLGLNSLGFSQIIISYLIGRCIWHFENTQVKTQFVEKIFNQKKIIDFALFLAFSMITFLMTIVLYTVTKKNYWFPLSLYASPLTVAASVFLFQCFKKIKIGSVKFVNCLGASTFGMYLIHENPFMRPVIYSFFHAYDFKFSKILIPYVMISCLIIFIMGGGIDMLRQKLFLKIEKICRRLSK